MTRTRASARAAGARFERIVADWLKANVSQWIDRRVKTGAKDRGDIANLQAHSQPIVAELKDYGGRYLIGPWLTEAETERANDNALAGVIIAKRRGHTDPGEQVVIMRLADFAAILTGTRPLPSTGEETYAVSDRKAGSR